MVKLFNSKTEMEMVSAKITCEKETFCIWVRLRKGNNVSPKRASINLLFFVLDKLNSSLIGKR